MANRTLPRTERRGAVPPGVDDVFGAVVGAVSGETTPAVSVVGATGGSGADLTEEGAAAPGSDGSD